jgi:transcriptional regulator with XRE-family HTH domain/methylmalonyl-CoA mutase cobalamin-binding subunit
MIGKKIKELRQKKHLNQQELASALNMKQSTIANYEKDLRTPNLETLLLMVDYFGISLDQLVGREEKSYNNMIGLSDEFLDLLLNDNTYQAETLAYSVLESTDVHTVFFKLFRYALSKLGWLWEVNAVSISKEHQISYEISRMISHITKAYQDRNKINSNGTKVIGMAAPGEKHNIGLKMTLAALELDGYDATYIGEAVPDDDLLEHLNKGRFEYLVLSITNSHLREKLIKLIEKLPEVKIYVAGNGAKNIKSDRVEVHQSYEACLEAIVCQDKKSTKENQK